MGGTYCLRSRKQRIEDVAASLLSSCWTHLPRIERSLEDIFEEAEKVIEVSDRLHGDKEEDRILIEAARFFEGETAPDRETALKLRHHAAKFIRLATH